MDFLHGAPRPLLLSSPRHFVDSPLHTSPCVRDFDAEITPKTGISATERIPELACVPGDPDSALVHEILWNHFGFIPHESDSGLDLEAHKLRVSALLLSALLPRASGTPSSSWNTRVRIAGAGDVSPAL